MVYIRHPTFKTAINVSRKATFDQAGNFTPIQKMELARNRIWGTVTGGNVRRGYKEMKAELIGPFIKNRYKDNSLRDMFPIMQRYEKYTYKKEKFHERMMRVYMRGVKIGRKSELKNMTSMKVFEMASKKTDADAQKIAEASFSDDSLGISSDGS